MYEMRHLPSLSDSKVAFDGLPTIFSPSLCRSLSLSLTLSLLECRGQEPRGVCVELIPKLVALEGVGG